LWVLLLCFTAIVGCNDPVAPVLAKATKIKAGEIGSRLPDFSATDLLGHKISSVDLRDKVVLIDIWATWCGPCKKEMPGYQTLADKYGPKGFAVIGLKANMMADTESPLTFAKKIGVHYPLVVATDDLLQKFGGLEGLPTTLLYDRQGIMRKKVIGFEYTSVFDAAVKSLL
jgi:thiol-disulfide isomerase/thioredoxin